MLPHAVIIERVLDNAMPLQHRIEIQPVIIQPPAAQHPPAQRQQNDAPHQRRRPEDGPAPPPAAPPVIGHQGGNQRDNATERRLGEHPHGKHHPSGYAIAPVEALAKNEQAEVDEQRIAQDQQAIDADHGDNLAHLRVEGDQRGDGQAHGPVLGEELAGNEVGNNHHRSANEHGQQPLHLGAVKQIATVKQPVYPGRDNVIERRGVHQLAHSLQPGGVARLRRQFAKGRLARANRRAAERLPLFRGIGQAAHVGQLAGERYLVGQPFVPFVGQPAGLGNELDDGVMVVFVRPLPQGKGQTPQHPLHQHDETQQGDEPRFAVGGQAAHGASPVPGRATTKQWAL